MKLYVGAPPVEVAPPPQGNPGSATACVIVELQGGLCAKLSIFI